MKDGSLIWRRRWVLRRTTTSALPSPASPRGRKQSIGSLAIKAGLGDDEALGIQGLPHLIRRQPTIGILD